MTYIAPLTKHRIIPHAFRFTLRVPVPYLGILPNHSDFAALHFIRASQSRLERRQLMLSRYLPNFWASLDWFPSDSGC